MAGSFSFTSASPFFCFARIACQTFSAAVLLAGEQLALESTNSQSLNESWPGSFCLTASTAMSHAVGAGVTRVAMSAGGALWAATAAMNWLKSSFLPWYFLYFAFTYAVMLLAAAALLPANWIAFTPYQSPWRSMGFISS